jgi:hypothetical protein
MLASDILDMVFFPVGAILMMDGGWTDGRGGWYICDGRNTPHGKTPDLKDKFIRGSAASGGVGGGSAILSTDNLPSHGHSLDGLKITGGDHSHGNGTLAASSGSASHSHSSGALAVSITGGTHAHTITDPQHTHRIEGSGSHTNAGYLSESGSSISGLEYATTNTAATGITINNSDHSHTATVSGSTASDSTAHEHSISGSIASSGHTHDISGGTIGNTGNGAAFDIVPAYYTVIYIKKMV